MVTDQTRGRKERKERNIEYIPAFSECKRREGKGGGRGGGKEERNRKERLMV